MKNIFINCFQSRTTGGKVIVENYIEYIISNTQNKEYFILVRDLDVYKKYNTKNIRFISLPKIFRSNAYSLILYYIILPYLLKKYKINIIFNFGDIIIPNFRRQIYFFDWAYALFNQTHIWHNMPLLLYIKRKIKVFNIANNIRNLSFIICQTHYIADLISNKFGINKSIIRVINTPVSNNYRSYLFSNSIIRKSSSSNKKVIFYPAAYASHKNFDLILAISKIIMTNNLNIEILITVDENTAKDFLVSKSMYNLTCIRNLGPLSHNQVLSTYLNCDALFFPSLLESYGLPLVEAMHLGITIIASDLPFARSICKDSAFYIDPHNANSSISIILSVFTDENLRLIKIRNAKKYCLEIPDWKVFNLKLNSLIDEIQTT